jgi:hypothetical protein
MKGIPWLLILNAAVVYRGIEQLYFNEGHFHFVFVTD